MVPLSQLIGCPFRSIKGMSFLKYLLKKNRGDMWQSNDLKLNCTPLANWVFRLTIKTCHDRNPNHPKIK